MPLRLVFMGTPKFSAPTLAALLDAGHEVVAVYSQPPRPAGRGMAETPGPVHAFAVEQGIPVATPTSFRTPEALAAFQAHAADAAVVVAYGLLLPRAILETPRLGCYNLHASKLPRWRGAAPIQRAIMAGDTDTAAMVMHMDVGLDTGPVCAVRTVPIGPDTTAGELHDALSLSGAQLMADAMARLEAGTLTQTAQSDVGVTYAAKIDKAEARIDFAQPASAVHNGVRGLSPFPGAWFETGPAGRRERIKVLRTALITPDHVPGRAARDTPDVPPGTVLDDRATIACAPGAVRLVEVQRAGKRPQPADEWLRGFAFPAGMRIV